MNHAYETADGERVLFDSAGNPVRTSTFPRSWGTPPADLEDRGRWIKQRIREGEERMNSGERVEGQRPRTGRQALAQLEQRVWAENINRLRLLALRYREGPQ